MNSMEGLSYMDGVMTMKFDNGQGDGVVNYCRQLRNEDPFCFIHNTCKVIHEEDCIPRGSMRSSKLCI